MECKNLENLLAGIEGNKIPLHIRELFEAHMKDCHTCQASLSRFLQIERILEKTVYGDTRRDNYLSFISHLFERRMHWEIPEEAKRIEKERLSYQELIQRLNQTSLTFKKKAGEKDHIFGSVSSSDIKDALQALGYDIEKKKILLDEPIKRVGNYTVPIKVYYDEQAELKVEVLKEEETEEEKKEAKEEK